MTEPLTTTTMDIAGIPGFILDAQRLLGSETWAMSTGDEAKAAVTLWCRAWSQLPAGSIPDEDRILANWCGMTPKAWSRVRAVAMRGFIPCSDGRLYHRVLCEDVRRTHERRVVNRQRAKSGGDARSKSASRNDGGQLQASLEQPPSEPKGMLNPAPSPSPSPFPIPSPIPLESKNSKRARELDPHDITTPGPDQDLPDDPILSACPPDIRADLVPVWIEIARSHGVIIASRALDASRAHFGAAVTPARFRETYLAAFTRGCLDVPFSEWPHFKSDMNRDKIGAQAVAAPVDEFTKINRENFAKRVTFT